MLWSQWFSTAIVTWAGNMLISLLYVSAAWIIEPNHFGISHVYYILSAVLTKIAHTNTPISFSAIHKMCRFFVATSYRLVFNVVLHTTADMYFFLFTHVSLTNTQHTRFRANKQHAHQNKNHWNFLYLYKFVAGFEVYQTDSTHTHTLTRIQKPFVAIIKRFSIFSTFIRIWCRAILDCKKHLVM